MKKILLTLFLVFAFAFITACGDKESEKTPTPDEPVEPTPEDPTQPVEPTPDQPGEPTQPVEPTPDVPTEPEDVYFTVSFVDEEGNVLSSVEVKQGESAAYPEEAPVKEGYIFVEYENVDLSNINENITVQVFFEKVYKINYILTGGLWPEGTEYPETIKKDESIDLVAPFRRGFVFKGWAYEKNGKEFVEKLENVTADVKLYAVWEAKTTVDITFDYDGGVSELLYLKNATPAGTISVTNYNCKGGAFWSGAYADHIFLCQKSCDPGATFSHRAYIGKNETSGLWEVKNVILSGGSSWADGAEYVLTISSSNGSAYRAHQALFNSLKAGDIVVFAGDVTSASKSNPIGVNFYANKPENSILKAEKKELGDSLEVPSKLGSEFVGWFEGEKQITSLNQVFFDTELKAVWKELNPVQDIIIGNEITDLLYGKTHNLNATVSPNDAFYKELFYSSSDTDIFTVDETGKITAVNCGTAVLEVKDFVGKVTITREITVTAIPSIEIAFSKGYNGMLAIGEQVKLTPEALGVNINNVEFTYESSDKNVALVNNEGLVSALAHGTSTIKITDNSGSNYAIEVVIIVGEVEQKDKVDKVLDLIVKNNFASVDYGNACLYHDSLTRVYDSMYGSVNNYLFDEFVIHRDYEDDAESYTGGHRSRRPTDQIEFVTVHDTATLTGTVVSIAQYMSSGEVSIHYTTGNDKIYSVVPEKYIAYHAGDGTGTPFYWTNSNVTATENVAPEFDLYNNAGKWCLSLNGEKTNIEVPLSGYNSSGKLVTITNPSKKYLTNLGPTWKVENGKYYIGNMWVCFTQVAEGRISSFGGNNNSIGIEMCVNYTNDIYDTYQRTAQLVADILVRNGLDTTRVKQHNTWSGKNCPQVLIAGNYWEEFMDMVEMNYQLRLNYNDVKITMKSNNPDIVDNTGRVYNPPKTSTTVSYDVTVSCGDVSKTMTLYSYITGTTSWERWDGSYPSSLVWNDGNYNIKK